MELAVKIRRQIFLSTFILLVILLIALPLTSCSNEQDKPKFLKKRVLYTVKDTKRLHREIKKTLYLSVDKFLVLTDSRTQYPFGKYKYNGQLVEQKLVLVNKDKQTLLYKSTSEKNKIQDFDFYKSSVFILKPSGKNSVAIWDLSTRKKIDEIANDDNKADSFFILPEGLIYKMRINFFKKDPLLEKNALVYKHNSQVKRLLEAYQIRSLAITKDRGKIAIFSVNKANKPLLQIIDLKTQELKKIDITSKPMIESLTFSHNSKWLAFLDGKLKGQEKEDQSIGLLRISNSKVFRLKDIWVGNSLSWSPTNNSLLLNYARDIEKIDLRLPNS